MNKRKAIVLALFWLLAALLVCTAAYFVEHRKTEWQQQQEGAAFKAIVLFVSSYREREGRFPACAEEAVNRESGVQEALRDYARKTVIRFSSVSTGVEPVEMQVDSRLYRWFPDQGRFERTTKYTE